MYGQFAYRELLYPPGLAQFPYLIPGQSYHAHLYGPIAPFSLSTQNHQAYPHGLATPFTFSTPGQSHPTYRHGHVAPFLLSTPSYQAYPCGTATQFPPSTVEQTSQAYPSGPVTLFSSSIGQNSSTLVTSTPSSMPKQIPKSTISSPKPNESATPLGSPKFGQTLENKTQSMNTAIVDQNLIIVAHWKKNPVVVSLLSEFLKDGCKNLPLQFNNLDDQKIINWIEKAANETPIDRLRVMINGPPINGLPMFLAWRINNTTDLPADVLAGSYAVLQGNKIVLKITGIGGRKRKATSPISESPVPSKKPRRGISPESE
jgi:hypothetical protein